MAPPYQPPPLPVAESYGGAAARADALPAWTAYFRDSAQQALIRLALEQNRDLRVTALRVREAQTLYGIQHAASFPVVAAAASEARSRTPGSLSLTGRPVLGSQYRVGVEMPSWELDFWGRLRSLDEAALESYLATDAARRAFELSLIAQVVDGDLALRELDERIAIARQTTESREESLRIFRRRFDVGAVSRLDLVQVETLLTQAQTLGAQLEQARAAQLNAMRVLLGTALPVRAAGGIDAVELEPPVAGLPSALLLNRPDLIAAEHQLKAANANIGAARAAFFPSISLTGSFGTASAELDGLFEGGSEAWSFMPAVSLPIFDAGRRRANLELTHLRRDIAVARYEKAIQSAFRDVSDALDAQHWLAEQLGFQKATVAAQAERERLAQLRYAQGAAPYLEVLDAQRDLLAARQQLVQLRRAVLSNRVRLYAALGGGPREAAVAP